MKIKEIEKTVNTSWSPADYHPILLAGGTAAQQLDASFSTSAALEIYSLNLTEPTLDLDLKASVPSQHRFHKIVWGGAGAGVIVGGCDNGNLQIYDATKLLNHEDALCASPERHSGAVRALDVNPFQKNLLATGASNSEIFIWDINNTATPMTPGAKSQPLEEVAWLAWNRQVQHILASVFPTRSVVWDLRKNEPIIKLTDTMTRVRWKVVAWHPEVATQLCLASEEDTNPVIQLWDLRFATSPVKSFHGHSRGVLSLAWCSQDPDLLISSGKDNRILCWNPNSTSPEGEIVSEIPNSQQWIFDISWCPRNPSLIASSSCDGHTSIYSLTGSPGQTQTSNVKIADSFPGIGAYPDGQVQTQLSTVDLKKAPKWLKRPCGASFGFGGKLCTFGPDGVKLFSVSADQSLIDKSRQLQRHVAESRFEEICSNHQEPIWRYLEACFNPCPSVAVRDLLGYNKESILNLLNVKLPKSDVDHLTGQIGELGKGGFSQHGYDSHSFNNGEIVNGGDIFETLSSYEAETKPFGISVDKGVEGNICKALLIGGIEEAIELCLEEGKTADALILAMVTGPEVLARTQMRYLQKRDGFLTPIISALVKDDWHSVVTNCELSSWKEALSALLTYCVDSKLSELCGILGRRLEEAGGEFSECAEICYIASGNVDPLIQKRTSRATSSLTPDDVQNLVELVLVARGAMSMRGQHRATESDDVARIIAHYGVMIASEGDLQTALYFVQDCPGGQASLLAERLMTNLGLKTSYSNQAGSLSGQIPKKLSNGGPRQARQDPPAPMNYGQKFPTPPVQNVMGGSSVPPMNPMVPSNAGLPNLMGGGAYGMAPPPSQVMPPAPMKPATPAPPPPTGSSFARNSPSPHIQTSTKKYVVDPSVSSGGGLPSFRGGGMGPASSMYGQQPAQPVPMYGSTGGFQQPAAQTAAAPYQPFQPPGSSSLQQHQPYAQPAPIGNPREHPGASVSQFTPGPPPGPLNPSAMPYNLPPQQQQLASAQYKPASGWNDPPIVTPKAQQRLDPAEMAMIHSGSKIYAKIHHQPYEANERFKFAFTSPIQAPQVVDPPKQPPITHPIFPTAQPDMANPLLQQQHQPQLQQQPPPQVPFNPAAVPGGYHQQSPSAVLPSSASLSQQQQPIMSGYGEPPPAMARAAEPSQPKPPVPVQYAHIEKTLNDLRDKCAMAANNNFLVKRKLDDVAKKLEALYDHLRAGTLYPVTLSHLEQLVQCVNASDYAAGTAVISQMVTGADFSQIASFMTGLKILVQTAQQFRAAIN